MKMGSLGILTLVALAAGTGPEPTPLALVERLAVLAEPDPWPGFDPRSVPVAVYDGERTWLLQHRGPVRGFPAHPSGLLVMEGRHPQLVANTAIEIDGVPAAGVVLEAPGWRDDLDATAGLVAHEAFHVFQRRHPDWSANEAELFTYPVADAPLLVLRRLESEAWRRSLEALVAGDASPAGWAATALDLRDRRFADLGEGAREYERHLELFEGLASYVGSRVSRRPAAHVVPEGGFEPSGVRARAYATGEAMARLLDHLDPGWAARLERGPTRALDVVLREALPEGTVPAPLPDAVREALSERARQDAEAVRDARLRARAAFLLREGWRLEITAPAEQPLWPQGFDPLNLDVVTDGEVLHRRLLKLGSDAGSLELLGTAALTRGLPGHPLFQGVDRVIVTGLPTDPLEREADGRCSLAAEGLQGEVACTVERAEHVVRIRLP